MTATTKKKARLPQLVIEDIGPGDAYYRFKDKLIGLTVTRIGHPRDTMGTGGVLMPGSWRLSRESAKEMYEWVAEARPHNFYPEAGGIIYFAEVRVGPKPLKTTPAEDRYDQEED